MHRVRPARNLTLRQRRFPLSALRLVNIVGTFSVIVRPRHCSLSKTRADVRTAGCGWWPEAWAGGACNRS